MAKTVADQFTETLVATSHCSPPPTRRQRKPRLIADEARRDAREERS